MKYFLEVVCNSNYSYIEGCHGNEMQIYAKSGKHIVIKIDDHYFYLKDIVEVLQDPQNLVQKARAFKEVKTAKCNTCHIEISDHTDPQYCKQCGSELTKYRYWKYSPSTEDVKEKQEQETLFDPDFKHWKEDCRDCLHFEIIKNKPKCLLNGKDSIAFDYGNYNNDEPSKSSKYRACGENKFRRKL